MGVGACQRADAAVQVPAHGLLLRGGLGVKVHQHNGRPVGQLGQQAVDRGERAIEVADEKPADEVDHQNAADDGVSAPGRGGGVVERTQHGQVRVEVRHYLGLVPNVVARRDDVYAAGQQLPGGLGRNAEAAGGVLAVRDNQVERELTAKARKHGANGIPAGPSHHVANHQDTQDLGWLLKQRGGAGVGLM